jgi:hypothetical protein
MIAVGALSGRGDAGTAVGGIFYILLSVLYVIPAVLLSRYASQCRSFANLRHEQLLEQAVGTQKSFWKYSAILALVVIALYLLVLVGVLVMLAVFHHI